MNGSRPDPSIDGARKAEEEGRLRERHIVPLPGQTTGGSGDPRAIIHARIDNDFTYHAPTPSMILTFALLRARARELARTIAEVVPPGREQSLALTELEQAIMWANAGIARQAPSEPTGQLRPEAFQGGPKGTGQP